MSGNALYVIDRRYSRYNLHNTNKAKTYDTDNFYIQ